MRGIPKLHHETELWCAVWWCVDKTYSRSFAISSCSDIVSHLTVIVIVRSLSVLYVLRILDNYIFYYLSLWMTTSVTQAFFHIDASFKWLVTCLKVIWSEEWKVDIPIRKVTMSVLFYWSWHVDFICLDTSHRSPARKSGPWHYRWQHLYTESQGKELLGRE